MKTQIPGTGCPKCRLLEKRSREAIDGDLLQIGNVLTSDQIVKIVRTYQKEGTE